MMSITRSSTIALNYFIIAFIFVSLLVLIIHPVSAVTMLPDSVQHTNSYSYPAPINGVDATWITGDVSWSDGNGGCGTQDYTYSINNGSSWVEYTTSMPFQASGTFSLSQNNVYYRMVMMGGSCNVDDRLQYLYFRASDKPLWAYTSNITFAVTEKSNYANKLNNVTILLSNGQSVITNSSGMGFLSVKPNSSVYTFTATKTGYTGLSQSLGAYGETGGILNLEMEQGLNYGDYYITVSPAWIPSDGSQYLYGEIHKQGTGEHNLTDIKTLTWQWHKIGLNGNADGLETGYIETNNADSRVQYSSISGIYKGWQLSTNGFNNIKGATLPNPVSLNPIGATGSILTSLYMTDVYGNNYAFNVSNLIGDNTTSNNVKVRVQDAYTGALIPDSKISFRDLSKPTWWNISTMTGTYDFTMPIGSQYISVANVSGYTEDTKQNIVKANDIIYHNMYASGFQGQANKTQLIVYVRSAPTGLFSSLPLEGASVAITQINASIIKSDITGVNGNVALSANVSTAYTITASKNGYVSTTQTINTGIINPYEVYLYLTNKNVIAPTYTPTPYITPTPIQTIVGGQIKNGTAAVCGGNATSIFQDFKNNIACMGIEDRTTQDYAFAAVIILICAFILGRVGKGLGALVGAAVGFILSVMAGLIPEWPFFALIVIAGMLFGIKVFGSDK